MYYYSQKQKWKLSLFFIAIVIGVASLWYTNVLVNKLSKQERKKAELWAEATKQLERADFNEDISFVVKILQDNETVPVILVDENSKIISALNLDSKRSQDEKYLKDQMEIMKTQHHPIEITLLGGHKNYIFYKDSLVLNQLFFYPFIQLGVIFLFILVSYIAFSTSRKAEQNQVWVGMAKETAHQLGTPISSLLAWIEMYKLKDGNSAIIVEVEKDVNRLEKITERFSKIGNPPALGNANLIDIIQNATTYLKKRTSDKITFNIQTNGAEEIIAQVNVELFEWVIENLCKNSIDAMNGIGSITISLFDQLQLVFIDITDTGKGIVKSKFKTIFTPGYTTKKKGWGLGLSLAKRIIENYHSGKIFVKSSEINKGTTIRIALQKGMQ